MKKIVLESQGREVNITSLEEVETIQDIVTELIIPSFQASGFHPDTIADGLADYLDLYRGPVKSTFCPDCEELSQSLEKGSSAYQVLDKNYQIIHSELANAEKRITNHVAKEIKMAEQIVELQEENEMLHNQLNEQEAEENGNPQPDIICAIGTVGEAMAAETAIGEETRVCPECDERYPVDEFNGDMCNGCDEYRTSCPECGGMTDNDWADCDECVEEEERRYEEEMNDLGENEGDCIQTAPPANTWNTGIKPTLQSGWAVPPTEHTVEPEQEEIPEPPVELPDWECPECGWFSEARHSYCESCDYNRRIAWMGNTYTQRLTEEILTPIKWSLPVPTHCEKCQNDISMYDNVKFCPLCGHNMSEKLERTVRDELGCRNCGRLGVDLSTLDKLCIGCWNEKHDPQPIEMPEEVPVAVPAPEMNAVGCWSVQELEKEREPRLRPTRKVPAERLRCPKCNKYMTEQQRSRGEYECKPCEYRTDCTCSSCERIRGNIPVSVPKAVDKPTPEPDPMLRQRAIAQIEKV